MKPLNSSDIVKFLERFDDFKGSEIRSLEIVSQTEVEMTLTAQDKARAFDWVTVTIKFFDIRDAQLIEEKKLNFIDMSEGITFINDAGIFAFGVGKFTRIEAIKESSFYIVSKTIKYQEGTF